MRLLAIALTAALVGCSSGAIKGKVILGATPAKLGIYAALWSIDSQLSDPKDPHSALIPKQSGAAPTFMGTVVVGTTTGKAGSYDYAFHTLDRGLYEVGAYLADPNDPQPDILAGIHTIDSISLQEVDPSNKKKTEVSHDIYLGISAPGTGTIRGTVHASGRAANNPISVWAGDGSLLATSPNFFDQQKLPLGSTDATYALFNVPLGNTYLFADADVANDGKLGNDFVGFASPAPLVLDDSHTEFDNVDIWVDHQSPDLGSISGTLQLNAPVTNGLVELTVEADSYGSRKLVGLTNVVVNGTSADFTIPSMPFGELFLSSTILLDVNGTSLVGGNYYPGPPNEPGPIYVSTAAPNATVTMPVGVGQILGNITLKNIPASDQAIWVLVSVDLPNPDPTPGSKPPQLTLDAQEFVLNGATSGSTNYDLFGFTDGTFNVMLVPTAAPDADPVATINAGGFTLGGTPSPVTIEGGDRVSSDFTYDFAAH